MCVNRGGIWVSEDDFATHNIGTGREGGTVREGFFGGKFSLIYLNRTGGTNCHGHISERFPVLTIREEVAQVPLSIRRSKAWLAE